MSRQLIVSISLALLCVLSPGAQAQPIRILAAQADGFDAVSGDLPPTDAQSRRLSQIADALRTADADILVLDGIPNRSYALKLSALLKPATYQVAVFSTFPTTSTNRPAPASTTILSKRQPFGARSAEWRATGQIELPGGFAFAGFRSGTNTLCFYAADLPGDAGSSLSAAGDPIASRKRELAAQYLAHHIQWLGSTLSNQFTAFCVIGDFVTDPKSGRLENAGRALQQSGFGAWLAPSVPEPGSSSSPYTALLARNVSLQSAPTILAQRTLRQPVCVYEISSGGRSGTVAAASPSGKNPKAAQTPGSMVFSIWLGMILAVCAATVGIWWALRRGNPGPGIFHPTESSQLVLEVDEVRMADAGESNPLRTEAEMWQARALDAEQQVEETQAHVRAGLLQRMHTLVREHLVSWLSAQRGKLLASHDSGVQQVLELEERLQRIQGNFQEQLRGRDQRITELEQEIQAKEKLIRKLLLARANPSGEPSRE